MKRLLLLPLILLLTMCGNPSEKKQAVVTEKAGVAIYYFHGTNRCGNCMAIEENTLKALQTYFPNEVKAGTVRFTSVNVDDESSKRLVEECQASTMSLFMVKSDGKGDVHRIDYTEFALNNARINPELYMTGIRDKVAEQLK